MAKKKKPNNTTRKRNDVHTRELAVATAGRSAQSSIVSTPVLSTRKQISPNGISLEEKGTSGLNEMYGFVQEAYNAQLFWPQVQPLYSRLRRSMPEIVMIRNSFTSWARNVRPIVELPENPTDDDKRYKDFVESDFDNMEGGFAAFVDTLVNHVPFMGWGWWEAVPGIRDPKWKPPQDGDEWRSEEDDGLIGMRRLAWRDSSTFNGWDFDDRKKMRGLRQLDFPASEILLPLTNSLHMTFGDPNNPEGASPLEAVWRLERLKYGYEVVMGIGSEHAAGYLNVTKNEKGTISDDDKKEIETTALNILSAQEGNYAYWPFGFTGEVKDVPFTAAPAILDIVKHYSILVLSVYAMQWIALNTLTNTGAQASQVDSTDTGVFTFNSMMDGFAAQYDQQIGKRLFNWNKLNFPNITKRPKIRFSHIDKVIALTDIGSFLQQIDGILPLSLEDYKAIRKRTGFLPENFDPKEQINVLQNADAKNQGKPGETNGAPAKDNKPASSSSEDDEDELIDFPDFYEYGGAFEEFGGPGSGYSAGHRGIPGKRGGSLPRGAGTGAAVERAVGRTFSSAIGAGGITIRSIGESHEPKEGYVVATYEGKGRIVENAKKQERDVVKDYIKKFINKNDDILSQPGRYLGLWFNKENGHLYIDIVQVEKSKEVAIQLGKDHDQIAIWDIGGKTEIKTGGSGKKGSD